MFSDADAYERYMGRWSRRLAPELVRFAGVGGGDAVLDVGCGTGALSAAALAEGATRVAGIDRSEAYVAAARHRHGDARLTFDVGDATALTFADGSFDRTMSLLVLTFVPDAGAAVREMRRVTRTGGVVAAAVWDYGGGMQMLRAFWDAAVAVDPSFEPRDERHLPLCGSGQLAALWREAGFDEVEETALEIPLDFTSFDDYWQPFLLGQGPAGACVAAMNGTTREAVREMLNERLGQQAFTLWGRAFAVKGTDAK